MQENQGFAGLLRHFVPRNDGLIEVPFRVKSSNVLMAHLQGRGSIPDRNAKNYLLLHA
jgi:hypothetical protein